MIKYDYEITVNGNQAKLNKDIYLFRGNKNVHYYFAVKNASFNFKGSTDLIEKTNAINAAVTVIKPNNVEVASAIAKVENGKIHLKVTEDLIDEEVEVGDFDLVFDLFDDTDGAVTIPKVIGQFHVLERPCTTPISELVATNTTNEVDQALTDYAIVTYAEPVASTNADGTFAKKTWVAKEKITTAELNRMEEGISDVSSQCKDIANKTIIEDGKIYLVKSDGTKIDNGTTLPTSSGTILSNNIETYKCEDIGELFTAKADYIAWCTTLQYDKTLDKFVALINNADGHLFTTCTHSLYFIDPYDFTISEIKEIGLDTIQIAICNFVILDDGTYMFICREGTRTGTGNNHKYTSTDNGTNWTNNGEVTGIVDGKNYHLWNLKKLSNGRLIAGVDVLNKGIVYSDDNGTNWTIVVPSNGIGDYNAEICIIELETNKLMAIARKNMSGNGYNSSGNSDKALISYSTDNGTTWSAWSESNSIDNMNASCCDALVHDGVVEVFATSRWYKNANYSTTDYDNTGKQGALIHYTATVENALNDNFTKKSIIDYARGSASEYHAPSIAKDKYNNILIMHMDKGVGSTCTQRFLRGSLGNLSYLAIDGSKSTAKAYSAKYTEVLFQNMLDKINTLQYAVSQIKGSGVKPPSGTLLWTKTYNANDASVHISDSSQALSSFYVTSGYTDYAQDSNGDYYSQVYQGAIIMEVTKANCACYADYSPITDKSCTNFGMGFYILKDGTYYGVPFNSYYSEINQSRHTLQLNYQDGKFKLYFDGNENLSYLTEKSITSDNQFVSLANAKIKSYLSVDEVPTTGTYICIMTSQTYSAWYEIKVGEWD